MGGFKIIRIFLSPQLGGKGDITNEGAILWWGNICSGGEFG